MPRFEASSDTRFLSQTLARAAPGETITYETLSESIGRDVRKRAYWALLSALRAQLTEGLVFEALNNVGYRRLTDSEIVGTQAAKALSHIGRVARRTQKKVLAADFDKLTKGEQVAHNTQISMLGAVGHLAQPKAMGLLTKHVETKGDQLALGETLKFMGK